MTVSEQKGLAIETPSGKDVYVGRQPIYDRDRNLIAYELLFRSGHVTAANVIDGDQASFTVMTNALVEIGLERLVGDKKAFINLTRNSVLCEYAMFFPKDRVVMEVLEDVTVDEELLHMVYKFSDKGYEIALDDFVYRDELRPLLDVAGIVKIDVQALDKHEVRRHVEQFGNLKLLAEKVETEEEFQFCYDLGFEYFQGWFLAKPKVITVKHVPTSQLATLRLLTAIHDPDATEEDLAHVISQDVALSYRLMRSIDPARYDRPIEIVSVLDAVRLLGMADLHHWVTLLSISGQDDCPPELMERAILRARFCELLGRMLRPGEEPAFFVAGLLSVVESLVGANREELFSDIPLSETIAAAVLRDEGPVMPALACAQAFESGSAKATCPGVGEHDARDAWEEAVSWASAARQEMGF